MTARLATLLALLAGGCFANTSGPTWDDPPGSFSGRWECPCWGEGALESSVDVLAPDWVTATTEAMELACMPVPYCRCHCEDLACPEGTLGCTCNRFGICDGNELRCGARNICETREP